MVVAAIAGIVRYAWRNGAERCGQSMRRIAAVMVLALAALAGPGLTGAKSAVAADAMLSSPGLAGTSASPAVTGTRLWVQRFAGPGSGDDLANSVAVSPSGGTVFVTGYTFGGSQDYTTFAYNAATGAKLWARRYNGPGKRADEASSLAVSPSGGAVFVTGYTTGAAGTDYATVAYDAATGARLWAKRYNGPGNGDDYASSVAVSPSGDTVYVTGTSTSATPGTDYVTVAYDAATGATRWVRRYHGLMYGLDGASKVTVSPSGDMVYVTGTSIGTTTTNYDYATVAYNAATGTRVWVSRYNGPANAVDSARSLAVSPSGDTVFVTGSSTGTGSNDDYATVAYNAATGTQVWASRYNGPANSTDAAYSVAVSPVTGAVFVTGISYGRNGNGDYLTVGYGG